MTGPAVEKAGLAQQLWTLNAFSATAARLEPAVLTAVSHPNSD
jgi:hypothetical protein